MEVDNFSLVIDGQPKGQPRPRFRPGQRPYPDRKQKLAEGEIRRLWQEAGSPRMQDGPLALAVYLGVTRPAGHFKRDGSLSAEGERHAYPSRTKPDLDNAVKLVCDALNTLAWRDDVRFCEVTARRWWAAWPSTEVHVHVLKDEKPRRSEASQETARSPREKG